MACDLDNTNVRAFLKLLRYAENWPRDDDGLYYVLYGGKLTFSNTTTHPNITVRAWGHSSNAAGAYQILYSTWLEAKTDGVVPDFSPRSQDTLAFSKLRSRRALQFVCDGDLDQAIPKLIQEWVSLPGGKQSNMAMSDAKERYTRYQAEAAR